MEAVSSNLPVYVRYRIAQLVIAMELERVVLHCEAGRIEPVVLSNRQFVLCKNEVLYKNFGRFLWQIALCESSSYSSHLIGISLG